jgi:GT2 family glycosyltransferase
MFVSVVIRSYQRRKALNELVARLRRQRYPRFEIVIFEQSDDPAIRDDLDALGDARIRVVPGPRKDPPAARNAALRCATGDILLLIDDDDLPLADDWIERHVRNYDDPGVMGVMGRWVGDPDRPRAPRFPALARRLAMRHTVFKDTVALANNTLRKESIDFLVGTNASFRRTLLHRIGGWDEGIPMHGEQSFAFKFGRSRRRGERFVFDPSATIWRRTDVPGGLNRRGMADWHMRELEARLFYYEHVVGHYFALRYQMLRPLFWLRAVEQVLVWIWDSDNAHRALPERVRASAAVLTGLPEALRFERFSTHQVRRVPAWDRVEPRAESPSAQRVASSW